MNKPKFNEGDRIWDEQCGYREPTNFQHEWKEDGCIRCPSCDELLSREEDEQLVYCDNCGYDF